MCLHICRRHDSKDLSIMKVISIFFHCKKCPICGCRIYKDVFHLHIKVCHAKIKPAPVSKRRHWPMEDPLAA